MVQKAWHVPAVEGLWDMEGLGDTGEVYWLVNSHHCYESAKQWHLSDVAFLVFGQCTHTESSSLPECFARLDPPDPLWI